MGKGKVVVNHCLQSGFYTHGQKNHSLNKVLRSPLARDGSRVRVGGALAEMGTTFQVSGDGS